MTDVQRLLREYIERFEAGGAAEADQVLAKAEGPERQELVALVEGYLEHEAPAQAWNPAAFEGSVAERAVAQLAEQWSSEAGEIPHELVALRNERKLKRSELVKRLADGLGFGDREEKVGRYYH